MIIVIEGIDNSGKSTLARELSSAINWKIQSSEGPPQYPGELDIRLAKYQHRDQTIFDRHPVVSQTIYGTMRGGPFDFNIKWSKLFYESNPLLIYCDPGDRHLIGHKRSLFDTDQHLRQIEDGYDNLLAMYRSWAVRSAHLLYRIGDDVTQVAEFTRTWIRRK